MQSTSGRNTSSERPHQPKPIDNETLEKRNLYERYTNYIDSSKCTIQYYQQKKFFSGQEKYIHKINSWIEDDTQPNKPLVFRTQPDCGMKTILVNWQKTLSSHSFKKEKILSLMHFASNGSNNRNYFYSLYRIIIQLREAFKIKQNVDLLEENIRKFFAYWLDICSAEVEKQLVIYCAQEIYNKIVIVIEGVDQFVDSESGKQANIAFWLPETFPKNVKVIVTAAKGSESLQHLEKLKCQIIDVKPNNDISIFLIRNSLAQQTILDSQTQRQFKNCLQKLTQKLGLTNNTYTFIEFFRGSFLIPKQFEKAKQNTCLIRQILTQKLSLDNLMQVQNLKELYKFVIDFWVEHSPLKKSIEDILIYLCLTQKGLTTREVLALGKISESEWMFFLIIFSNLIIKYEGIYSIKSTSFVELIFERNRQQKSSENYQQILVQYHQKLAATLESTPNCIRKLQEQTYHLFAAKSYFKLKEMISNIENFLLMFNPNNKYELSKYWQKLEEKGFDPVIEYNKAVEGFSMHYHPSDENIFRIIVQISRFLKEFCDFETYQTPNFRHPYIEGNAVELHKIGLLKELSDLDIFFDNSFNNNEDFDLNQEFNVEGQISELREKYFPKENLMLEDLSGKSQTTEKYSIKINEMLKDFEEAGRKKIKKKTNENVRILSQIEQLNVDVPMNREKFRNHYLKLLQQFMKKDQTYAQSQQSEGSYLDVEEINQAIDPSAQSSLQYSFNKIRENYRMRQIKPSLYYYKRWIWIQFPWVCISLNNNYSTTPELCKKIQGDDFDSLEQESKYTKQALMVAIEAREKKKQMFSKKDDYLDSRGFSKTRTNAFTISKFGGSKFNETVTSKTRNLNKTQIMPDLNLATLTKQLQTRKKRLKLEDREDFNGTEIFLSEVKENCQEDMKFISLRRQFQAPAMEGVEPNEVLPKLKWVIKQHTNYELNYIKSHIEEKKKKLNKIIYENKKLAEQYQELKIKETNQKKHLTNQHESQKYHKKQRVLESLIKKKEEAINDFCKSLLQKERLKIILKLCSQNKTKNQEYLASLNYLLQNLKKMINFEKYNMKAITEELEQIKVLKEKQNTLQSQKERNRQIVQREAQNYLDEKNKLQKQIENITAVISEDIKEQKDKLENSLSGHIKHKEEKTIMMMQERKTKLLEEKLQKLQEEYECLRELFGFEGFDFENAPKFKKLMEENQRNKQLKIAYFERKNKLEQVMNQYERIKQENQKEAQHQIKKIALKKEFKEGRMATQRKMNLADNNNDSKYSIVLNNIALKLGVSDKKQVVSALKEKLQYLKTCNPEKYRQLMGTKDQFDRPNGQMTENE